MSTETKTEQAITGQMTIGDIVQKFPETIEIMTSYGLHCVGCSVNYMETLEEGALGHGMPEDVFQEMVQAMNREILQSGVLDAEGKIISLSPSAAEKIKELMEKEGKKESGLFVGIEKGGCSGNNYVLRFEDKQLETYEAMQERGIKVFMSKESISLLKGIRIDYVDGLQGAGFKIVNPNAHRTCGCGQSFR